MFVSKENVAVNVAHELIERQQSILDITKAKVAVNVAVNKGINFWNLCITLTKIVMKY